MKIMIGTRVKIRPLAQKIYDTLGVFGEVVEMETVRGVGTAYTVRDTYGKEYILSRDEFTPIAPPAPEATSATIYGVGVTETRKVRASVPRTPSRPRARKLRILPPGSDPLPPRS